VLVTGRMWQSGKTKGWERKRGAEKGLNGARSELGASRRIPVGGNMLLPDWKRTSEEKEGGKKVGGNVKKTNWVPRQKKPVKSNRAAAGCPFLGRGHLEKSDYVG